MGLKTYGRSEFFAVSAPRGHEFDEGVFALDRGVEIVDGGGQGFFLFGRGFGVQELCDGLLKRSNVAPALVLAQVFTVLEKEDSRESLHAMFCFSVIFCQVKIYLWDSSVSN